LVVVAIGLGWIVISRSGDSVNVRVNTEEVKKDTGRLVDGAKDALTPKSEPAPPAPANP